MRLIRDGENGGKGVWRWGKRESIYLSLHCHHQNDSCIKVGGDESHFNVSLIVRDKRPQKPQGLLGTGRMGGRGYGGEGRGGVYTYRYTVTTRMTCIKVGSDESHFNVSLTVRDKFTRQCPQATTFEEKGEPKRYRTEVLPLISLPPYR